MSKNLESLTIHAFRGLRELELEQLGQVNLFVGPNNSGKTSVLEAISVFSRPLDPREWLRAVRRRELKLSAQPVFEGLRWMFPQSSNGAAGDLFHGETRVTGTGRFPVLEARAECEEMLSYESESSAESGEDGESESEASFDSNGPLPGEDGEDKVIELRLSATVQGERTLFDPNPSARSIERTFELWQGKPFEGKVATTDPAIRVATVSPFAHRVEQFQVRQLTALRFDERKNDLLDVIRIFDSDIVDLEILSPDGVRAAIYVQHRRIGLAPLSSFGDGLRRALTMAMNLVLVGGGNLLVDEIESSVHFSALGAMFKWLAHACARFEVQLFATTHSLEAVDALLSACEEQQQLDLVGYHLDATPEKTVARRFEADLLQRLRFERGLDWR